MKNKVLSIAALAVTALVAATGALAGGSAKKDAGTLNGAGSDVPVPADLAVAEGLRVEDRRRRSTTTRSARAAASPRSRRARSTSARATRR